MEPNRKPLRNPNYRLETVDDETLLYHPGQTRILYCNSSASLVWHLCNGELTIQEIIDLLAAAYPEAAESLPDDVHATLSQLAEHGAIGFG